MKKVILLLFALTCCSVNASEVTEDYLDMATNYCIQGNYREASVYLDKILLLEPDNNSVKDLRNGIRQLIQGNKSSFILSKSPSVKRAVNAKKTGNRQGHIDALDSSNDFWAYYFLGEYYKQNKKYNDAISYFVKSINLKTNFTQCYLEIAVCYFELGNYNQTITYLNQYLKANETDAFAYTLRARANANLGNNDSAMNDILTASAMEESVENKFLEGKILYNMGRYEKALSVLEPLAEQIQTAEVYKYIGLSQSALGHDVDALINLDKSIILFEDDKLVNSKYNELKSRIEK